MGMNGMRNSKTEVRSGRELVGMRRDAWKAERACGKQTQIEHEAGHDWSPLDALLQRMETCWKEHR